MHELQRFYEERKKEVEDFLDLLDRLELAGKQGRPKFEGDQSPISPRQVSLIRSSTYLQLYNIVEATVSKSLDELDLRVSELSPPVLNLQEGLRREWLRYYIDTHGELKPETRLDRIMEVLREAGSGSVGEMAIAKKLPVDTGGGGNWDDINIEHLLRRLGCSGSFSPEAITAAKKQVHDGHGALSFVRERRNGLAHGRLSFGECVSGVTTSDLAELAERVLLYLDEYVKLFCEYLGNEVLVR